MALVKEADEASKAGRPSSETVIAASMIEPDIARIMAWPHANICTNGELDGRHPRGFGAFPRVLGRYVREQQVMPLAQAIRKMTSLPAHNVGLPERGRIVAGAYADLVLLDPSFVLDRATPAEPTRAVRRYRHGLGERNRGL